MKLFFSRRFLVLRYIFNLDNDIFVVTSSGFIDIFKIEDKKVNKITSQSLDKPNFEFLDARIPNTNYFAILRRKVIDLYNKDDFKFVKTIPIEMDVFNRFYKNKDDRIFLGGFKIGFFDVSNWKVIVIRDDNMKRFQGYLAGVENDLNYYDIIVTDFNSLICIKHLKQVRRSTYDDVPDEIIGDNDSVCLFKFNAENNTTTLIETKNGLNPKNIYLNEKDELVITCSNGIQIYKFD